ncbi:unnamed protein product [Brachionus calyciflorus]|uniref:G-protein coupled receptors family 2 profile 2 domain-containing protein n=1 Tax=Brachionus calyciflorus TaxID=104777 RepID=A0A813UUX4_9BILA|nr:unnamed protein product [Brachionus calyciflorus]
MLIFLILIKLSCIKSSKICKDYCNTNLSTSDECFCSQNKTQEFCLDRKLNKQFECSMINQLEGIYTLAKCPKNSFKNDLLIQCEQNVSSLINLNPVYSHQTNIFYKNIYCLLCNVQNIQIDKIKIFILKVNLREIYKIKSGNLSSLSKYTINFPDGIPEPKYCNNFVDSCPLNYTTQSIIDLCHNYSNYKFTLNGNVYKNEYCVMCNEPGSRYFCNKQYYTLNDVSIQILFDLSNLGKELQLNINATFGKVLYNSSLTLINSKKNDFKKYFTIIGHSISIVSIIILIILYCINKLYVNLPGKILINLSISLMMSQGIFLASIFITNEDHTLKLNEKNLDLSVLFDRIRSILPCFITSLLTHYFYLSYFFWTNVMALDLYVMFDNSISANKVTNEKSIFLKYSVYTWLSPLLILIGLNFKNFNKLSYGYRRCFISSDFDLLIFFILPVGVLILINFVLLSLSIRLVLKIDKLNETYIQSETESERKLKRRLILFLKLFLITGTTWGLGVICSVFNEQYSFLWYIYLFFNSFQGLFILFSYVFNMGVGYNLKRIFNLKKRKL